MATEKRLKLAFLGDGASAHVQRLALSMADRGYSAHVISADDLGPYPELPGVTFHLFTSAQSSLAKLREIRGILQRIDPDILHSHFVNYGGLLGLASGFHPHIVSAWGCDVLNVPKISALERLKVTMTLRSVEMVLPVSEQLRDEVIRLTGREEENEVFQWGIDTRHFSPVEDAAAVMKTKFGLGGKKLVLSPRALQPLYNQDLLIEAWPAIVRRFPEAILLISRLSAFEDFEKKLKSRVEELGVGDSVRWTDPVPLEELPSVYSAADVMVSVARSDGTPMTLLEAMSCGLPVVVSDLPSIRPWVNSGVNGQLVKLTADDVARGVIDVLSLSDDERQRMKEANRAVILSKANRERCLDRLEEIYREVEGAKGINWGKTLKNTIRSWSPKPLRKFV